MGFTHYWKNKKDVPIKDWNKITEATKELVKIQEENGIPIVDGNGQPDTHPEINDNTICLNGQEEDSHETLYIQRTGSSSLEFCKTNGKPYDTLVVAVLTIISDLGYAAFSSNGDDEDLEEGRKLGREVFSKQQTIPAINNIKERMIFNDVDSPESGYLLWDYGSQFLIMDRNMTNIDVFNVSEANEDFKRAREEAKKHFKSVRFGLSS